MDKRKKIILISVVAVIVVALIGVGIYLGVTNNQNNNQPQDSSNSKLNAFYENLKGKEAYSVTAKVDDNNHYYYAKEGNKAYLDSYYEGEESEYIIKDGNTYLVRDDEKVYYTYNNNETDLNKIQLQIENLKDSEYVTGKEKVEKKQYQYEEYTGYPEFLIKGLENSEGKEEAKTRFYFEGDKLVYVKTIVGDYQEIVKLDISDTIQNNLFEIPSDYEGK